ncbi:hypothetical protein D3C72_1248670 [compost metagenome]
MRATREDSGWKTDEPVPTSAAASSTISKLPASASSTSPLRVKHMPIGRDHGIGYLSVQ